MTIPFLQAANAVDTHRIIGYSTWRPDRILTAVLRGQPPSDIPGDFVLTARLGGNEGRPAEDVIITSAVSARPYYYVHRNGQFHHGQNVFALVRDAGLTWRWNPRAIACLAWVGHPLGEDTLHPDVRRVPPSSVLRHSAGHLSIRRDPFWDTLLDSPPQSLDNVADMLETVLDELLGDQPLISFSAGFDSRAILSRALATGTGAQTLTMGSVTSTDRQISDVIARDLGIQHHTVELDPADYFTAADSITRITGGTKVVGAWHTYLYTVDAARHGAAPHIVGTNGEFARTCRFDKGTLARLAGTAGQHLIRGYFTVRIERRRRRFARDLPELGTNNFHDTNTLVDDIVGMLGSQGSGLDQWDRYYSTQRVRHFQGNGLALYQHNIPTMSPFLDSRWIRVAARLRRSDRLGCNLHRHVIQRNFPKLLEYPTGKLPAPLSPRARAGYWVHRKPEIVHYTPYAQVIEDPRIHAAVIEEPGLDELFPRHRREAAVRARVPHVIDLLLTVGSAARVARATTAATATAIGTPADSDPSTLPASLGSTTI